MHFCQRFCLHIVINCLDKLIKKIHCSDWKKNVSCWFWKLSALRRLIFALYINIYWNLQKNQLHFAVICFSCMFYRNDNGHPNGLYENVTWQHCQISQQQRRRRRSYIAQHNLRQKFHWGNMIKWSKLDLLNVVHSVDTQCAVRSAGRVHSVNCLLWCLGCYLLWPQWPKKKIRTKKQENTILYLSSHWLHIINLVMVWAFFSFFLVVTSDCTWYQ